MSKNPKKLDKKDRKLTIDLDDPFANMFLKKEDRSRLVQIGEEDSDDDVEPNGSRLSKEHK